MSSNHPRVSRFALARAAASSVFLGLALAACGGGGGGSTTPPGGGGGTQSYTVGGTISGLSGTGLVLQDNGVDNLTVSAGATTFTFKTALASGASYAVTVLTSPTNPTQACTVTNGTGKVNGANVTNVAIACTSSAFTIGGTVTGLTGTGLMLQNNKGNTLAVNPGAGGATVNFVFTNPIASGTAYAVTVSAQPTNETCTVANGSGTVASANVSTVAVSCKPVGYTIGGTVKGLTGSGLVLQDNGGDNLTVAPPTGGTGTFTFATPVNAGAAYAVTVKTQPSSPTEVCSVSNGSGTVGSANVTTVVVSCGKVGQFVFVANPTDGAAGDISAFTINSTTGALSSVAGSPFATGGTAPKSVVVDTTGQFVYAADRGTLDISTFTLDPATGILTLKAGTSSTTGEVPTALAVSPTDGFLIAAGYSTATGSPGALFDFAINNGSGSLTKGPNSADAPIGGYAFNQVAVDPTGQFLFVTAATQYLFSLPLASDGTFGASPSRTDTDTSPWGVVVWPNGGNSGGYVYTANQANGTISAYSYDSTGTPTALTGSPFDGLGTGTMGIAIDPSGKFLYATNKGSDTVAQYTINAQTGVPAPIGSGLVTLTNPVTTGSAFGPVDIKVDPSGQFVYVLNTTDGSVSLLSINATTGALTLEHNYAVPSGAGGTSLAVY